MRTPFKIKRATDVLEFRAWAENEKFTLSAVKEELEAASAGDEDEYEFAVDVFSTIESRSLLLGAAYPFRLAGSSLEADSNARSFSYMFCVALSILKPYRITNDIRSREFEGLTLSAAKSYFGGEGIRVGAPWRTEQYPDYDTLLNQVSELVNEVGQPREGFDPGGGDGGWDIIIARGFADRLYPQLMAIGNCATSRDDFRKKGLETSQRYFWEERFQRRPISPCIEFLAVPFDLDPDDRSRKSDGTNIIFDRSRLCEHCANASASASQWLDANKDAVDELALL